MNDKYFEQCYLRANKSKHKLDFPLKSRESMKELLRTSTTSNVCKTPGELKETWKDREVEGIDTIKKNANADVEKGKNDNSNQWLNRINKRKIKAKLDSDERIDKAFHEMYESGKDKSKAEQEAIFFAWDSFELALKQIWDKLYGFFRDLMSWLKDAWDNMYKFISDTMESIKDGFIGVFG